MIAQQVGREKLVQLGWNVEDRAHHVVARLEHRQILIFDDGRVIFKDPTIRARYQLDDKWLQVSSSIWPDVPI
jgi:hypothetical protein